eukprot:7671165-Pyramimonas_sp.AAC.1
MIRGGKILSRRRAAGSVRWSPSRLSLDDGAAFLGLGKWRGQRAFWIDQASSLAGKVPPALPFVSIVSVSSGGSSFLPGPP